MGGNYKMLKTIIFDFDGTIADSFSVVLDSINQLSSTFNYKPIKDTPELHLKSIDIIIKNDLKIPFFKIQRYLKELKKVIYKKVNDIHLFNNLKSIIKILSKRYSLAIMTSNSGEIVKNILNRENISEIKHIYPDISLSGKAKVIAKLLKDLNLNKDEVIYIGDETRDIDACKKIGIKSIAVTWGYNSKKALKPKSPDYIADKPEELIKIINSIVKFK